MILLMLVMSDEAVCVSGDSFVVSDCCGSVGGFLSSNTSSCESFQRDDVDGGTNIDERPLGTHRKTCFHDFHVICSCLGCIMMNFDDV